MLLEAKMIACYVMRFSYYNKFSTMPSRFSHLVINVITSVQLCRLVLLCVSVFCSVGSIALVFVTYKFRKAPVLKSSSPIFHCITLFGCMIMYSEVSRSSSFWFLNTFYRSFWNTAKPNVFVLKKNSWKASGIYCSLKAMVEKSSGILAEKRYFRDFL